MIQNQKIVIKENCVQLHFNKLKFKFSNDHVGIWAIVLDGQVVSVATILVQAGHNSKIALFAPWLSPGVAGHPVFNVRLWINTPSNNWNNVVNLFNLLFIQINFNNKLINNLNNLWISVVFHVNTTSVSIQIMCGHDTATLNWIKLNNIFN